MKKQVYELGDSIAAVACGLGGGSLSRQCWSECDAAGSNYPLEKIICSLSNL